MSDLTPQLTVKVAPYAIQDLGSNLYTGFPRVLAEFVANAYDADASYADISFDFEHVARLRQAMRKSHAADLAESSDPTTVPSLATQKLPDVIAVEIRDDGFGMSPEILKERFLWVAKKRRSLADLPRTKNRPLMGRKGLGKLAGFGVASVLEVITKTKDMDEAIEFKLDYDQLLNEDELSGIAIESEWNTSEFKPSESGTIIRLKRLGFDAVKSQEDTVSKELSEHFEFIRSRDFRIRLNKKQVPAPLRDFAFAWPEPDKPQDELIEHQLDTEAGTVKFKWRIRFRKDRQALAASQRGIRIYASNRLASSPSLFNANTNMHGFRMTDYLDGIVQADFIDSQPQDYIATDRQSLRWETPLLAPMKEFLSQEIKEACKQYQGVRDAAKKQEVDEDPFTTKAIDSAPLGKRERSLIRSVAVRLAKYSKQGVNDPTYKKILPDLVHAVGHGRLYEKLSALAESETPNIAELVSEVVLLNRAELDASTSIIRTRLRVIETLNQEVRRKTGASEKRNEVAIQKLFEQAPWIMNPVYYDYLTADKSMNTTVVKLAEHLKIPIARIDPSAGDVGAKEADFVFLLGSSNLNYVLIVELKATTKPAVIGDILQLKMYMKAAEKWLKAQGQSRVVVRGELICTPPEQNTKNRDYIQYWDAIEDMDPSGPIRVRSYIEVINDAELAHKEILQAASSISMEDIEPLIEKDI